MDESSACVQTVQMMLCKSLIWPQSNGLILGIVVMILIPRQRGVNFCCRAWTMALQDARINVSIFIFELYVLDDGNSVGVTMVIFVIFIWIPFFSAVELSFLLLLLSFLGEMSSSLLCFYFQMIAAPQIGFAQEVMASAPPPYSEYAQQPQVTYIVWMQASKEEVKCCHCLVITQCIITFVFNSPPTFIFHIKLVKLHPISIL